MRNIDRKIKQNNQKSDAKIYVVLTLRPPAAKKRKCL
jgi:hypothetical protein